MLFNVWPSGPQHQRCRNGLYVSRVVSTGCGVGLSRWQALERVIPDVRRRAEVTLVGTPLTHARFLRRHRGTYGPAIAAGQGFFPGPKTPVQGLLCCGDSTFPGIGLPAVAASGWITANTLVSTQQHLDLLRVIDLCG